MAKSVDEMTEAELDAFLSAPVPAAKKQQKSVDEMSEAELDAFLLESDRNSPTKQAQRELINERVEREKAAIEQRYKDQMTAGDKIGAGVGAGLMGAGRLMNPLTDFVDNVETQLGTNVFRSDVEAAEAQEQMPGAYRAGQVAGFVGQLAVPAGLAKAGATLPVTAGQTAMRVGLTNAGIGAGVSGLNEASQVLAGKETVKGALVDTATSGVVSGLLGAGAQGISNKLAANAVDDVQNAVSKTVKGLTPQKRNDLVEAADKFGVDFKELADDISAIDKGEQLSKMSPLRNFHILAKNKVFDGVKDKVQAVVKLNKLANDGSDEFAQGLSQLSDDFRLNLDSPQLLKKVIDPLVNKSSKGHGPDKYFKEFVKTLDDLDVPEATKQDLLAGNLIKLNKNASNDLIKEINGALNKHFSLPKEKRVAADLGVKVLTGIRSELADMLESTGIPLIKEGNEKMHAALTMKNILVNSDKHFSKENVLQATWRRISGALTPIGAKLAIPRAALDMIKADAPIPTLAALQGPTKLARNMQSLLGFLNQPQVIQNLAPQDAGLVKEFLNLPPEKQQQLAPQAMKVIEKTGVASFDFPLSGYASEIDGKLTDPADILAAGQALWQRTDIPLLHRAKLFNDLNLNGKVPAHMQSDDSLVMEDQAGRLIKATEHGSYGIVGPKEVPNLNAQEAMNVIRRKR